MTPEKFNELVERRLKLVGDTLMFKGQEYAGGRSDRLHNFKRGAQVQDNTPAETLRGYWTKHIVSVFDFIEAMAEGKKLPAPAVLDEKLGDAVNYLFLLEGIIADYQNEKHERPDVILSLELERPDDFLEAPKNAVVIRNALESIGLSVKRVKVEVPS